MDMKAESQVMPGENAPDQAFRFSLRGPCPHCSCPSAFVQVSSVVHESRLLQENPNNPLFTLHKYWAVLRCQGCNRYIIGAVSRKQQQPMHECDYLEHFPLGRPDDTVPSEIPENIAMDFKEALRCRWVDAYNATAEMCRRAIEASCIEQNAPVDKTLNDQIDWLFSEGKITKSLKDMAHKIRLGGNRGAHPPENPLEPEIVIGPEYADAVIEFTRDYFQYVYVNPKRLQRYDFRKKTGA